MNAYQPTDEQIESLATHEFEMSTSCEWATARDGEQDDFRNWARQMSESPAFQAIIRAAQAEALREARVTAKFAETLPNDGVWEYTSTADCNGSNVRYLRRKPTYAGDYHPWEPTTEQAWASADYPADRIEAADV